MSYEPKLKLILYKLACNLINVHREWNSLNKVIYFAASGIRRPELHYSRENCLMQLVFSVVMIMVLYN